MNIPEFRAYVADQSALADAALQSALDSFASADPAAFSRYIYQYILYKFLLADLNQHETDLKRLAEQSLIHTLELTNGDTQAADVSFGCSGASTAETKKVILLLVLKEKLGVSLPPDWIPDIVSSDQLAAQLYTLKMGKNEFVPPANQYEKHEY